MQATFSKNLSISDLFSGDLQLSSPPIIYFKLQKLIEDPNKSVADTAMLIETDASLSLKLLKIVNSAFYGFPSKITSINQAINLIGTKELQNIVLSTIVIEKFSDLPGGLISMQDFWERSLRCALIAQEIDVFLGKSFSDSAFICGILHNIGQLVFFQRLPELSRQVNFLLESKERPSESDEIEIEKNVIGFDHYEAGAALTSLWKLPKIITDSISLHSCSNHADDNHKIASIIRLADFYSKVGIEDSDPVINNLEISPSDVRVIIGRAEEKIEEILNVFIT
ncbi:MAG: HDOD domain-containing protein [Methyloprofundus sp.]|nr:HDOD domain-containing protein [Methyloprofundus sp.]